MATRLAAYAVCIDDERILLTRWVAAEHGVTHWTLPGGQVEHGEHPADAAIREVAEETGYDVVIDRLLGVDSRVIPTAERLNRGPDLHNVGVFYEARVTGGVLRAEANGDTAEPVWKRLDEVRDLPRSRVVDSGLALLRTRPDDGHVEAIPVGGLVRH